MSMCMPGVGFRRNPALGQVWTPDDVAYSMAQQCVHLNPNIENVLDPACGPGTFSRALSQVGLRNMHITSYDIDSQMQGVTDKLHQSLGIMGKVETADYLEITSHASSFDLVIMNPPYIRHELIETNKKRSYHTLLQRSLGVTIDKRANLFALFLLKGLSDLKSGGLLCAIVYDAINHSAYGKQVRAILGQHAQLLKQRHVQTPFNGVLVDAQILVYRKRTVPLATAILGEHDTSKPSAALNHPGTASLGELLNVRRGTALPLRKLFLAKPSDPHHGLATPMLVKQASLPGLYTQPDQRAYLLNEPHISSSQRAQLQQWLVDQSKVLGRIPKRLAVPTVRGPILFNYYIRNAARHLWNGQNLAAADNFYVASPTSDFDAKAAWLLLNSSLYLQQIEQAARSQGNGLSKLQLYEYRNVSVPDWRTLPLKTQHKLTECANRLITENVDHLKVRHTANQFAQDLFK